MFCLIIISKTKIHFWPNKWWTFWQEWFKYKNIFLFQNFLMNISPSLRLRPSIFTFFVNNKRMIMFFYNENWNSSDWEINIICNQKIGRILCNYMSLIDNIILGEEFPWRNSKHIGLRYPFKRVRTLVVRLNSFLDKIILRKVWPRLFPQIWVK